MESRRERVDAAREAWVRRLVDTSRRNNLLYFRDLRVGTLDLAGAREGAVDELLMGAKVPLAHLAPDDPKAPAKLKEIARKALSNREERGLETLYLAYGMASWPADDGGRPPEAAVVLLPLAVEGRATPMLVRSGPPRANLALLHALAEGGYEPDMDEESEDPAMMLGRLQATVPMDGFTVRPRAVVGNFSFQKLSMVQDLRAQGEAMAAHDAVAALAGDPEARAALSGRRVSVEPRELDAVPPAREFMPLDADSSQQAVVHAVARGSDGVIQGPPGCGKSQTIANLIATLVAQGQRVLFVAEKRAALEAVHKRLDKCGLGGLCLDLHGATVSQKAVVARIADALAGVRAAAEPDDADLNARFEDRRARLVAHERLMHAPVVPSGLSPFALQAAVLGTAGGAKTRWRGPDLARLDHAAARRVEDLLDEAAGHRALFLGQGPWAGACLDDGHAAQAALDAANGLATELPGLRRRLGDLAAQGGIPAPTSLERIAELFRVYLDTEPFAHRYDLRVLPEADGLRRAFAPGARAGFAGLWARLFDGAYRAARRRLDALAHHGKGDPADLPGLADVHDRYRAFGLDGPSVVPSPELLQSWKGVSGHWEALRRAFPTVEDDAPEAWVASLLADAAPARAVPRVRAIAAELERLGAGRFVAEIRVSSGEFGVGNDVHPTPHSPLEAPHWKALFRGAWLRSCHDALLAERPELAGFSGAAHEVVAEEFRSLDRGRTRLAAARTRRAHAEAAVAAMNAHPEQADLVRGEAQKRSRHRPLRRLLAEAPDVLPAVLPCWMASPLNVSQLLPPERALFDVVVFDEASQVLPEDAVCAVLRGKRLVVAGDRHQLPPTVFFADGGGDEEEESAVAGYGSLLDQAAAFLEPWPLLWHYRSHDERLIAFSNRHIYGDRLVTFPGVGGAPCVEHVLVASPVEPPSQEASKSVAPPSLTAPSLPFDEDEETADPSPGGERGLQTESPSAEVLKAVELILDHAQSRPDQTLGVIAMGLKHAMRIEAALDRALDERPDLEPFFDHARPERFFVKNLEQVQGDERDAILISVGYGKDASGRLPYRFGPLLQEGGERRLNVAVTRARQRMTVVSSFGHEDMDPGRPKARGVELLREFLRFASRNGSDLGGRGASGEPMNPFEADVYDALTARGVPLTPQYGVSGYRLDFAAAHPDHPGRFVLAIECDGASYHSAPTARDRDRLRQQQLEALGWRFHRIWSTDWTLHRERETDAAVRAWEDAVSLPLEGGAASPLAANDAPIAPQERGEPPTVAHRDDIEDIPPAELDALVRWTMAGGLPTDDEIVEEVAARLGYARVGAKIARTVAAAIERVKGVGS